MSRSVAVVSVLVAAAAAQLLLSATAQATESEACPVITSTTTSFFTGGWGLNWRTTATLDNTCPSSPNGALVKYRWRVNGKYEPIAETCVDDVTTSVPLGVRETTAANPYPSVSITHITHLAGACPA